MAVQYRLYQNNNSRSNQYKKWYARAVMIDTVDTDRLAEQIEANCTVKRADVLAVLSELVVVMKQELQNSKRVKLNSFGSFKLALTTGPASTAKEFSEYEFERDKDGNLISAYPDAKNHHIDAVPFAGDAFSFAVQGSAFLALGVDDVSASSLQQLGQGCFDVGASGDELKLFIGKLTIFLHLRKIRRTFLIRHLNAVFLGKRQKFLCTLCFFCFFQKLGIQFHFSYSFLFLLSY